MRTVDTLTSRWDFLIRTATRAPSVHNTQPWLFRRHADDIELYCDRRRRLRVDTAGREMLISCGAALYGLRLAVRSLGCQPVTELLPVPSDPRLLARVRLSDGVPMTASEEALLAAMPYRHTHRGEFEPDPLPDGLIPALQHDAVAEGAELVLVHDRIDWLRLADITDAAGRKLDLDPRARADVLQWSRSVEPSHDGVPGRAYAARPDAVPGRLRQRDWDLGRGEGKLIARGAPAVTAVLLTRRDDRGEWLRAGQALHRLLLHAATRWVFASLHSQPLQVEPVRELIATRLELVGHPQMILQLGNARMTAATGRRPPSDVLTD